MDTFNGLKLRFVQFTQLYAICSGATGLRYTSQNGKLGYTKYSQQLAIMLNGYVLFVSGMMLYLGINGVQSVINTHWNQIMRQSANVSIYATGLCIVCTIFTRIQTEQALLDVQDEWSHIMQQLQPKQLSCTADRKYNFIFYTQNLVTMYVMLSGGFTPLLMPRFYENTWYNQLFFLSFTNAQNLLMVALLGYFIRIWQISKAFCCLNIQLQSLLDVLKLCTMPLHWLASHQLQQLTEVHWRLSKILQRFNQITSFRMFVVRCQALSVNILMGYFAILLITNRKTPFAHKVIGATGYLLFTLQIYLLDSVVDLVVQEHNESGFILKQANEFNTGTGSLNMTLDIFAWRFPCCPLQIRTIGLYDVNKRSWFSTLAASIAYTVMIIQFHLITDRINGTQADLY